MPSTCGRQYRSGRPTKQLDRAGTDSELLALKTEYGKTSRLHPAMLAAFLLPKTRRSRTQASDALPPKEVVSRAVFMLNYNLLNLNFRNHDYQDFLTKRMVTVRRKTC